MNIIGSIIKKALELKGQIKMVERPATESQKNELRSLLSKASQTAFGKYYGFQDMLSSEDPRSLFAQRVPLHNYTKIHHRWWSQQENISDITWPSKPEFYARSSGTTGSTSKRIPVTEDLINSMRSVSLDQLVEIAKMDIPNEVFSSEALAISSSAELSEYDDTLEGEISGINVYNMPDWYNLFYRPGKEIARISDWDERTDIIAREAPTWDIGIISGIPSWVQLCLQKIIERNNLKHINEIWPHAKVFISGGVAFSTYEKSFRSLFGHDIKVIDTYLASEGFMAFGSKEDGMEMKLALSHGYYFEFIPFEQSVLDDRGVVRSDAKTIPLEQLSLGKEYILVISSCAGAWRYIIGDVVQITSTNPYKIKITGRTKFFLNVVGSQLSEDKMNQAIKDVSENLNVNVNEFMVACVDNEEGEYFHHWIIVTNDHFDTNQWASDLDKKLKGLNNNYKVARNKALQGVEIHPVSKDDYKRFLDDKKKLGGQVKIPKVTSKEDMLDMMSYFNLSSA